MILKKNNSLIKIGYNTYLINFIRHIYLIQFNFIVVLDVSIEIWTSCLKREL